MFAPEEDISEEDKRLTNAGMQLWRPDPQQTHGAGGAGGECGETEEIIRKEEGDQD